MNFAVPGILQSTKAALSVNASSPFPKLFRSQVALPVAEHSPQHYGFVRRLHPLILSCPSLNN